MKTLRRSVVVRDRQGNDRHVSVDIKQYDSLNEAADNESEAYALRILNDALAAQVRTNARNHLLYSLRHDIS